MPYVLSGIIRDVPLGTIFAGAVPYLLVLLVGAVIITIFPDNLISRDCCYKCPYTTPLRSSDLTLGDFHGFEEIDPDFAERGVSLVLPHTQQGLIYCQRLAERGRSKSYPLEQCLQPRLRVPPKTSPLRRLLLKDLLSRYTPGFFRKYQKMLGLK